MSKFLIALLFLSLPVHALPRPDHVVVVIEENRGYSQIMNTLRSDSYIHQLAKRGMLLTQSYAVSHPSQPNYLALFSGSTQGSTDDNCPLSFTGDNLASSLIAKGYNFSSYSESMPEAGYLKCMSGPYQRKHNPAANWPHLPPSVNMTFDDFPKDFSQLPTISFVIPDQHNDMHDGSFFTADEWLKTHIDPYVQWAFKHNSLLILTWDEDSGSEGNHIATILAGPMIRHGASDQPVNHYSLLRTLLDFYGATAMNASHDATPIRHIWNGR